jgi:hypothetical protein
MGPTSEQMQQTGRCQQFRHNPVRMPELVGGAPCGAKLPFQHFPAVTAKPIGDRNSPKAGQHQI